MRFPLLLPTLALLAGCFHAGTTAAPNLPPPLVVCDFEDDYGNVFRVSPTLFERLPRNRFRIVEWNSTEQYFIAHNDSTNVSDGRLWTRVDWVPLADMAP